MTFDTWLHRRRGQAMAAGLACLLAASVWFAAILPAWTWFRERDTRLDQRQALLSRMRVVVRDLPQLRQASRNRADASADGGLMSSPSDAVAAATLQKEMEAIATSGGIVLAAVETSPPVAEEAWHKIGLRISFNASWPHLIDFLQHVEALRVRVRVFVGDLHLSGESVERVPVHVSMQVYGLRLVQGGSRR